MQVNMPMLLALRAAEGRFVPIAQLLGESQSLDHELRAFAHFGFSIERHPFHGLAYRGPAQRLCPDQIEWELNTVRIGRRIAVWDRVRSTNDLAAQAASSRSNDGYVVLAESQTRGRGRRGHKWFAPPRASVLMSVLVFPPETLEAPAWLTALGAVAVAEVVEQFTGQPAQIKWPNDVRVGGRKIAGVLVERGAGAVIGIGLNANLARAQFPEALRAQCTSLQILTGQPADRSDLARALIRRLNGLYEQGLREGPGPLSEPWKRRLESLGREVSVETASATFAGRLLDADFTQGLALDSPEMQPARRVALADVVSLSSA